MSLSDDLVSRFAKITKDDSNNRESTVYGTVVSRNDKLYVNIDGSDSITPIVSAAEIKAGERVTVLIKDHTATVLGNISNPSASTESVGKVLDEYDTIIAKVGNFELLIADKVSTEYLEAKVAVINELIAGKASIGELDAVKATIKDLDVSKLEADIANINQAIINKADIADLDAIHADIDLLEADVANINTLIGGHLTMDNIQSLVLTSSKVTVDNAFIKDAMIDRVSASKINSGIINTNNVTIQSDDGSMLLKGTLQQFKDSAGNVRIQIGKDAKGDFTFVLYGADGKGQLINQNGITASAISDGLIVNSMVSDNANISGEKLDINSVVTEINNGTKTIKGSKVILDEKNQTFDVAFNKLSTTVENIQIGGRNLVVNSDVLQSQFSIVGGYEGTRTVVDDAEAKSKKHLEFKCTTAGTGFHTSVFPKTQDKVGKTYTWSFWAKCNVAKSGQVGHECGGRTNISLTTEWQKFTHTWVFTDDQYHSFTWYINWNVDEILYIRDFKIEEGNKATDWTPAPEDTDSVINTVKEKVDSQSTQLTVAQGQIQTLISNTTITKENGQTVSLKDDYSSFKQTVDGISSKVGSLETNYSKTLKSTKTMYYVSTSTTTLSGGSWSETSPTWTTGKYIWQKLVYVYGDGTTSDGKAVCIQGAKGDTGATGAKGDKGDTGSKGDKGDTGATGAAGQSVTSVTPQFQKHTSNTTAPTGTWLDTCPAYESGKYLWVRNKVVFANPSATKYTNAYYDPSWDAKYTADTTKNTVTSQISKFEQTLSGFTTRVESVESTTQSTAQNVNDIKSKVAETITNLDGITDRVSRTETKMNTMSIGGRNFLYETGIPAKYNGINTPSAYVTKDPYGTYNLVKLNELGFKVGDPITVSFDWELSNVTTAGSFRVETVSDTRYKSLISGPHDFGSATSGHYVGTKILNENDVVLDKIRIRIDNSVLDFKIKNMKLEKGNVATDWTPSPEDVNSKLGSKNLLLGTHKSVTITGKNSSNQCTNIYNFASKEHGRGINNKEITLSFDYTVSSGATGSFKIQSNGAYDSSLGESAGAWATLSDTYSVSGVTGVVHKTRTTTISIPSTQGFSGVEVRMDNFVGELTISNMQIEYGDTATDWSSGLMIEELSHSESILERKADNILLQVQSKVDGNSIISAINMSPESIKISASKVNITGFVTFSDLSGSGTTTINGANIKTGYISGDRIKGGTLTAAKEINFEGGARIFGNTGELNAGLTISAAGFNLSGGSINNLGGNWYISDDMGVDGSITSNNDSVRFDKQINVSGNVTGTSFTCNGPCSLNGNMSNTGTVWLTNVDISGSTTAKGLSCSSIKTSGNVEVSGHFLANGNIYGMNNIALSRGSLYAPVGSATRDYLRFGTHLLSSDPSYGVILTDSAGDWTKVRCGTVIANGTTLSSDKRLKTDIKYINLDAQTIGENGLEAPNVNITTEDMHTFIETLPIASYRLKSDIKVDLDKTYYGFIAQDILYSKVGSELIEYDVIELEPPVIDEEGNITKDGVYDDKGLRYSENKFITFICGALQEEIKQRKALERRLNDLMDIINK